nr:hypothetical protein [Tanacetum cinerariifolium]
PLLRFAKERLCPIQNFIAFFLEIRLRFSQDSLRFDLRLIAFCLKTRCVLPQDSLRFAKDSLRFISRPIAFCLKIELRFVSRLLAFFLKTYCVLSIFEDILCVLVERISVLAVATTDDSPAIPEHTTVETPMNMSPANKAHFEAEKEAIHLILTGIGDEIYSTVDACQTAQEMWEAIETLQQGESLNIQDVKTNLFWEFGKFTSDDGETMESYYTRFYKLMNEMIRNNLTVATMQVNV